MNIKIIHLILLFIVVFLFPPVATPGELYIWVDKNGGQHITDRPPDESARIVGVEAHRQNSPAEIQRYQAEQKAEQRRREAEESSNKSVYQVRKENEKLIEAAKEWNKQQDQKRAEWAAERIDDLNARKERLRAIENKDYKELRRLQIRDEERKADRNIKKYEKIKDQ